MAPLSDAQIEERLQGAGDWRRGEDDSIVRELKLPDFVAELAEAANHHPDILIHGWNKVRLTLSTHSEGGITDADFRLAAQIDGLA
jgi:4a-hydroxytetrahydrobiopterin dehydratase